MIYPLVTFADDAIGHLGNDTLNAAARAVCSRADDPTEAALVLAMLGLIPTRSKRPPLNRKAGLGPRYGHTA